MTKPKWDKHTQQEIDFIVKHLTPLEGATITSIGVSVEDFNEGLSDEPWWVVIPILTVETKLGSVYQVAALRDSEGNGEGWLDIHEVA